MRRTAQPNRPTAFSHRRRSVRFALGCLALAGAVTHTGCEGKSAEERGREAAEKISESMPDVEAIALAQKINADVCKEVQGHLIALHEYQGEANGTLDSVTVNAIQAFQRSAGLRDTGIVDERTRTRLADAAQAANK